MRASARVVGALTVAVLAAAPAMHAQSVCGRAAAFEAAPSTAWPAPLDRVVQLQARDVSLRDALARLAAAGRVRISYSSELLPLDRRVCVSHDAVLVGDAFVELLRGTNLEPRAVAADHIALAPVTSNAGSLALLDGATSTARTTPVLDPVVVRGPTSGRQQRSLPIALDVITSSQIDRRASDGALSRILDGSVPGIWLWEQPPASLLARYGSIRGASSFGASYPKVYIDGIEVANPLVVTQLSPDMVERIEVIRGPQGAALYGTDAISGVINIVTRNDGPAGGQPRLQLRSDAGVAESDFASRASLAQHHSLTLRVGSGLRSAGLGVMVGTVGAYVPEAFSRQINATGSARFVGARTITTLTGRFVAHQAGAMDNLLVSNLVRTLVRPGPSSTPEPGGGTAGSEPAPGVGLAPGPTPNPMAATANEYSARQYTLGVSGRFMPNTRWTHTVTLGVDGYRLADVADETRSIPRLADGRFDSEHSAADRGTLRLSSVASFGSDDRASASLTFAAEHTLLREGSDAHDIDGRLPGVGPRSYSVSWRTNSGVVVQSNVALREALYLTGGLRVERNDGFIGPDQTSLLPMLGAAFVRDRGDVTIKVRGAYGKGIRPPRIAQRETMWAGTPAHALLASLAPEEQSGTEAGIDLMVGRRITMQVTRFDQLASGLIHRVATGASMDPMSGSGRRHVSYAVQNVGQISNRGWELEASAAFGRLSLGGTMSFVDSRVRRLAVGYSGDLQSGDRMLGVPARTSSATASWSGKGWSGALTASRASDWVNYDRLALASAGVSGEPLPSPDQMGPWLRSFWRTYGGVTRLQLTTSRDLRRGVALVLTGENLLDRQLGEPDNVTVLPGRTITAGIRAAF
jgi:iron complex outermembrane recepter protein